MKVQELIIMLQQAEKMTPGLDVGLYDTEFMVATPPRHVQVKMESYYDYEKGPDNNSQLMVVLSS